MGKRARGEVYVEKDMDDRIKREEKSLGDLRREEWQWKIELGAQIISNLAAKIQKYEKAAKEMENDIVCLMGIVEIVKDVVSEGEYDANGKAIMDFRVNEIVVNLRAMYGSEMFTITPEIPF